MLRTAKCAGVATVVAGLILVAIWYCGRQPQWPGFDDNHGSTPQYVVRYNRDFGYRTGSIVPVSIFFKVPKGTTLDVEKNMQAEGDMLVVNRTVSQQSGKDGVQYVRLNLEMQAFVWKQEWSNKLSFVYRIDGSPELKTLELTDVSVTTSKTYDGDTKSKHPKDPDLKILEGYHMMWTIFGLVVGIAGMVGCVVYLVRTRKTKPVRVAAPAPKEEPKDPWEVLDAAIDSLLAGDHSPEAFDLVSQAARAYTGLHMETASELIRSEEALHQKLGALLLVCEGVVWGGCTVGDEQLAVLSDSLKVLSPAAATETATTAAAS